MRSRSKPSESEREELRSMAAALESHGYPLDEARRRIWSGFCGGMDGAREVCRMLDEIPEIGDEDIGWQPEIGDSNG